MIESLLSSRPSWVQLGLVLAHFLWQGAAIAVVLAAVLWLLRRRSPNARYGVCGLAMLIMAVSPILTLWYVRAHPLPILADTEPTMGSSPVLPFDELGVAGGEIEGITEAVASEAAPAIGEQGVSDGSNGVESVQDSGRSVPSVTSDSTVRRAWMALGLELVTAAWCVGVVALSVRLVVGWWRLRRHCRRETEALPEATEGIVRRLSRRLGLARPVRVLTSRVWNEPIAFGLLRPVVLLPISVLTQCPAELIEAMIAHELAHIRRYDLWVNLLQRVIETLLFYHPAVWWVSGRMRLERELCCDDLAIGATGRRADYATALVELCRMNPGLVTPAMAAGIFGPRLSLLTRVQRILQVSARGRESNRGRFWLAGPLSIVLAGAFVVLASFHSAVPQDAVAAQPTATKPADAEQLPAMRRMYTFNWNRQTLTSILKELQDQTGLSMPGADDLDAEVGEETISFTSVRPVGFDDALLLVNHLLEDKKGGYWIVHRDQYLEIRRLEDWFRRIPPAQMFATEEAYRKVGLPKWEMASVVYQPRHASAKPLADRAMDEVPDNTARARPTPDGNRIELKGIVEYIEHQLEVIRKWDVPQAGLLADTTADRSAKPTSAVVGGSLIRKLQPGDRLNIRALDFQQLGKESDLSQTVDENGDIYLPGVGKLKAQGLTPSQLRDKIIEQAKEVGIYGKEDIAPAVFVDLVIERVSAGARETGKAAEDAGRVYSRYGGLAEDELSKLYSGALGAVHFAGSPNVPVNARTDGVIVEVKVKNGQTVKKDDLLARFDDEEIKIDLAAAEIRLQDSLSKLKWLQIAAGAPGTSRVSRKEQEQAESAAKLAELDVQRCRLRLERCQIKSPADGVVVGRGAPENDVALLANQQVKAGELLMYIQPAEQAGSTGTTVPKSRLGAAPKSAITTRPSDAAALAESLAKRSSWLGQGPQAAELENAIRDLEASREELQASKLLTDSHPSMIQLQKRIEDLRKTLSQSAASKKVYARADGVVGEVKVQDGQMVKKGDLLVRLDDEEVKLDLAAAEVRLGSARKQYEFFSKVNAASSGNSEAARREFDKLVSDLKLAEIEVSRLKLRLNRTQVTSPADGKVRAVEGSVSDLVGKRVTAGDLLLYVEPADSAPEGHERRRGSESPDAPTRGRR